MIQECFREHTFGLDAIAAHQRALEGEAGSFEVEWGERGYSGQVAPIEDSCGTVRGVVGIALDDTDRRRAQGELRRSERRYRQLFEASADVIFMSLPDGTLVDVNRAGVELFGFATKREMLACPIEEYKWIDGLVF